MSKIPDHYRSSQADVPKAYVGQPKVHESDEWSSWSDPSNKGKRTDRGPMDALDPKRPSGSQQSGKPTTGKSVQKQNKEREIEKKKEKNRKKADQIEWFRS